MQFFIEILGDILHISKIILICSLFFEFDRRNGKYQKIRILVVTLMMFCVSVYIYKSNNVKLNAIVYLL